MNEALQPSPDVLDLQPPSMFVFQADVLRETAGDPSVWTQCSHNNPALQPGQRAGEVLQDQLRLQQLRQPRGVWKAGHRTQGPWPRHLPQRLWWYDSFPYVCASNIPHNQTDG